MAQKDCTRDLERAIPILPINISSKHQKKPACFSLRAFFFLALQELILSSTCAGRIVKISIYFRQDSASIFSGVIGKSMQR